METDVVISNQHNQFCVGGMSEHPVEAAHVVLPVLQRDDTGFSLGLSEEKLTRVNGVSEGL